MPTCEIDLAPLQSFYLSVAKSHKRANGELWNNAGPRLLDRIQQRARNSFTVNISGGLSISFGFAVNAIGLKSIIRRRAA
jgi:hypothetical protein